MATIAILGAQAINTNAGNHTVTTTPTVGELIVCWAASTGLVGGLTSVTDDNADGLGTYTLAGGAKVTGFSTNGEMGFYVRNSLIGSGTSTIFTETGDASTSGGGLAVFHCTGITKVGSAAIRGYGFETGVASATPTPVLPQAALTTNPLIGVVGTGGNPANVNPRTSPAYGEVFDTGFTGPNTGIEIMTVNSGETASSIAWGSAASNFSSMILELDASGALVVAPFIPRRMPLGV